MNPVTAGVIITGMLTALIALLAFLARGDGASGISQVLDSSGTALRNLSPFPRKAIEDPSTEPVARTDDGEPSVEDGPDEA